MGLVIVTFGRGAAPPVFWGTEGASDVAVSPLTDAAGVLIPMGDWCARVGGDTEHTKTRVRKSEHTKHRGPSFNVRAYLGRGVRLLSCNGGA